MVSRIRFADPGAPVRARLDAWDLGGLTVLRADLAGDLALARAAREAREDAEPTVSFAVQEVGVARQEQFGHPRVVPRGGLSLTEVASPYEYRWSGSRGLPVAGGAGQPARVAGRRRPPGRPAGPPQPAVRAGARPPPAGHPGRRPAGPRAAGAVAGLGDDRPGPGAARLRRRPVPGRRRRGRRDAADPGAQLRPPAPHRARAWTPSRSPPRTRSRSGSCTGCARRPSSAWSSGSSTSGWRAPARELAALGSRDSSIAMVARRWGFTDPSYFSRRFRQSFGLTPRDWRSGGSIRVAARPGGLDAGRGSHT